LANRQEVFNIWIWHKGVAVSENDPSVAITNLRVSRQVWQYQKGGVIFTPFDSQNF